MYGCLDLLTNLENIIPSLVVSPNDTQTSTIKHSLMVLRPKFITNNVLYVPHLSCNLIYVGQLVHAKQSL